MAECETGLRFEIFRNARGRGLVLAEVGQERETSGAHFADSQTLPSESEKHHLSGRVTSLFPHPIADLRDMGLTAEILEDADQDGLQSATHRVNGPSGTFETIS